MSLTLLSLGMVENIGEFSNVALVLVLIAFGLTIAVLGRPSGGGWGLSTPWWLGITVALGLTNLRYLYYPSLAGSDWPLDSALIVALTGASALAVLLRGRRGVWALAGAGLFWIGLIAATWGAWGQNANTDVLKVVNGAATALLHGQNPYGPIFEITAAISPMRNGWLLGHFTYGPIVPVLAAPGALIGDVRTMSVVAVVATFAGLWVLARRGPQAHLAPRIVAVALASPLALAMIHQAWVEVYLVAAVIWWLALRREHRGWAVAALAVGLLVNPITLVVLGPAFLWSRRARLEVVAAAGAAAMFALPFMVATGFGDFVSDAIVRNLTLPPRYDALTVTAFIWQAFGVQLSAWLPAAAVGLALLLIITRGRPRDEGQLAVEAALLVFATFLLAKEGFFNYYYVAAMMLMAAIAGAGMGFAPEELTLPLLPRPASARKLSPWLNEPPDHPGVPGYGRGSPG